MPRKSSSSGYSQDSKGSSLRRFGSLASFHSLAFLTRTRRSNNACDEPLSSPPASDISLRSSLTNSTNQSASQSTARFLGEPPDAKKSLPPTPPKQDRWPARKGNYMPLPVDPAGGMPRSRTLSYLPMPTRLRQGTPMSQSTSQHHLLPAARSSRIPSTSVSTRRHETSKPSRVQLAATRMQRSDTEPLLAGTLYQASADHVSIQKGYDLKENVKSSPIKPGLTKLDRESSDDWFDSSPPLAKTNGLCRNDNEPHVATLFSPSNPLLVPRYSKNSSHEASPLYQSSPTTIETDVAEFRSKASRAQRWNSQPALLNRMNLRSSHQPIEERRLMSTRGPPTPLLPPTPVSQTLVTDGRKLKIADDGANKLLQISEESPSRMRSSPKISAKKQLYEVDTWEPTAYWCGRFTALCDRFRNEELRSALQEEGTKKGFLCTKPRYDTDKLNTNEAHTLRQRRALETLYSYCITHEACDSLIVFQMEYAVVNKIPDLARDLKPKSIIKLGGNGVAGGYNSSDGAYRTAGWSSVRRPAFMGRLMGMNSEKRRSWAT